ncbi:MAG TPA: HAMP domain-containing sensor histidine kinase [Polyangiales bacterium]
MRIEWMVGLLAALWIALASAPVHAQLSRDGVRARAPSHRDMHFAPRLDAPRFDVQSAPADALVVSRPRSAGSGLEGFLIDVPSLVRTLDQRVLAERGLDDIASLRLRESSDAPHVEGNDYPYRFNAPFSSVEVTLRLAELDQAQASQATWLKLLSALFVAVMLTAIGALYRMVAVQVHFATRRANFVSAVSHELKTPLTAIRMYSELLRDGLVASEQTRQDYYGLITSETERLSRLVENVLRLGQIERRAGRPPTLAPRQLPSLEQALALIRPRASALGFHLHVEREPNLPPVQVDPDGLTQVLFNTLDNALKYAAEADDKRIDVHCVRHGDGVRLTVRDYGPGVPPTELKQLFEPFYRAGNELTRGQQGVGLGLSLVKRVVEDMGGRVECRNAEPGFEVTVILRSAR